MEIGVDIGGTKIAAGVVMSGKVVRRLVVPTPRGTGRAAILKTLKRLLNTLSRGKRIDRVGIGIPGRYKGTRVVSLEHVPELDSVDLHRSLGVPVALENDARAFTIAEHTYGAAKGKRHVVGLTIGTGIGGGIIIDGHVLRGSHGAAGELGHLLTMSPEDPAGLLFWERVVSGPAILERYRAHGGTASQASAVWRSDDSAARSTRSEVEQLLAGLVAGCIWALDPEIVVLGGGVSSPALVKGVNRRLAKYRCKPIVRMSALGSDAGILGAWLALH